MKWRICPRKPLLFSRKTSPSSSFVPSFLKFPQLVGNSATAERAQLRRPIVCPPSRIKLNFSLCCHKQLQQKRIPSTTFCKQRTTHAMPNLLSSGHACLRRNSSRRGKRVHLGSTETRYTCLIVTKKCKNNSHILYLFATRKILFFRLKFYE